MAGEDLTRRYNAFQVISVQSLGGALDYQQLQVADYVREEGFREILRICPLKSAKALDTTFRQL
jgi:hypothetical protein